MSNQSLFTHHLETIAHLGLNPRDPSDEVMEALDELEQECGRPIPAAVRQWYALEDGLENRNLYFGAHLIPLIELGVPYLTYSPEGEERRLDLVAQGRLLVMGGEDANCLFAVDLDGTNDPPVLVTGLDIAPSTPEIPWYPHAGAFSAFILSHCWVNAWIDRTGCHMLSLYQLPGDQPLSTDDLVALRNRFAEGPRTTNDPCGVMTSRFNGRGVAFQVTDVPDGCVGRAGDDRHRPCPPDAFDRAGGAVRYRSYRIKAESDDALVQLARDLREWGLVVRLTAYTALDQPELDSILRPICRGSILDLVAPDERIGG